MPDKSTKSKSSDEPQFEELSNAELDDVHGGASYVKLGDIEGESVDRKTIDTDGFKIEIDGFQGKIEVSKRAKY